MPNKSPYNPLDDYQSYSVQYVMLACRTTEVAKNFASTDDQVQRATLQAIENAKYLGSPIAYNGRNEDVFLVIDTRRFAQFTIDSVKYDVLVNGLEKQGTTSNLATDLTMTILDSTGVSFANFLQWLLDEKMKTNYDGMIFMLRIIFVGHLPDGSTTTIQTETIPMHLNRMEINLDYAKGAYTLEFLPNMNFDVKKHARFLTVSTATSYNTGKGNKLGGLIKSFETELNDKSTQYYLDVQKTIQQSTGRKDNFGRKVQYLITIPKKWNDFVVKGVSSGAHSEVDQKAEKEGTSKAVAYDTYTGVSTGSSIPSVLDYFFKQVPEIAQMGNFKSAETTGAVITFFKHIVGITSTDSEMIVHVDVVEFKIPNAFAESKNPNGANQVSAQDQEFYEPVTQPNGSVIRKPKNFLEWDYIFTGLNKDILSFDMKIEDFQFLLASNLRVGDNAMRVAEESGSTPDKTAEKNDDLLYARPYDPIVMPQDTKKALENYSTHRNSLRSPKEPDKNIAEQQQYTKNLSMFYAGSPVIAVITIKGNPLIMHKFNIGQLLNHPTSADLAQSGENENVSGGKQKYREDLEKRILKITKGNTTGDGSFTLKSGDLSDSTYATSPVFAKLNIKGPSVDFKTNEERPGEYATSVLSDNYYVVFRVSNLFSGAMFTQELELYVHNVFGRGKITKEQ